MSLFNLPKRTQQLGTDITKDELRYHRYRVLVSKEFHFDSAHHLHNYEGKCKQLHGHTYKVVFGISSYTDVNGLAIDFGDIKTIWQQLLKPRLDHQYLNVSLPKMNTTAENIVVWIFEQMDGMLHSKWLAEDEQRSKLLPRVEFVRLYETPTSYAEFKREWLGSSDSYE